MNDKIGQYTEELFKDIIFYAPKIGAAILVFILGLWLINYFTRFFKRTMRKRDFDVSLQLFLSSLVNASLKIILLITVASMLGIQTTSFVAIIGAAGLAVGLALQGSLGNFAGGVLTLVFKPYKVGDLIEAQGQVGEVVEIQIFNTILVTTDNRTVILPNGAVSNNTIINHSKLGSLRLEIAITIAPESNIARVRSLLLETCHKNELVLKTPEPSIAVTKLHGGIHISVRAYVDPKKYWDAHAQLHEQLHDTLMEAGIKEPVPEYAIYQK